ncbi:hypothetical protein ACOSQ2_028685 [Xanthoceras sorbifolium]
MVRIQRVGSTNPNNTSILRRHCTPMAPMTIIVTAYQEAFEKLSHRVDNLPEPFLVGCFIAGLRDEIRLDVKIKKPQTLADAIGRITSQEARERREKGLCYSCDEKFIMGHRCQDPKCS